MRLAVLLLLIALPALAADTGTIFGTVVHPEGGPAKQANLVVERTNLATQTDEQGRFRLEGVPVGAQTLRIFAASHESVKRVILVQAGDNPLSEIRTGPQKALQPIFVTRKAPPADTLDADALRIEIVPRTTDIKVFDAVQFSIRVYNRTSHPLLLLRARPNPDEGPAVEFSVAAPFDAFRITQDRAKSRDALESWELDFVEVRPGDWFDPFGGAQPVEILTGVPSRPGTYTASFRYSTSDPRLGLFARASLADSVQARLAQVPAVDVVAKTNFKVDY